MKILFPIKFFFPSKIGGPSNTMYWHTLMLNDANIETTVITTDKWITDESYPVRNKWIHESLSSRYYIGGKLKMIKYILKSIQMIRKHDIIHFSSICYPANFIIVTISILLRKCVVISPRGELFDNAIKQHHGFLKRIFFLFYRLLKEKLYFHATSQEEVNTIKKILKSDKFILKENFIKVEYNEDLSCKTNDIVFLGRINEIKNIDKLIFALSESDGFMSSNGRLLIIGMAAHPSEKEYENYLKKIIEEKKLNSRIVFCGVKEGSEKFQLLNKAKVLVLPSKSENFGNVIPEAMSQSTPVIASTGTPWEILKANHIGWWVDSSPDSLSNAINEVYELSDFDYKQLCRNSISFVREHLDINSRAAKEWVDIYKQIVKK